MTKAQKIAARFAAKVWYDEVHCGRNTPEEAVRFARENWRAFVSVVPDGWGKLLLAIAGQDAKNKPRAKVACA